MLSQNNNISDHNKRLLLDSDIKHVMKLTSLSGPGFLKKPIVITEIKRRRGGLLRSELELHHVRRPGLEPHAAEVLVAAKKSKKKLKLFTNHSLRRWVVSQFKELMDTCNVSET
jgi:hypothetical protein